MNNTAFTVCDTKTSPLATIEAELGEDVSFQRMLLKYLYFHEQAVPGEVSSGFRLNFQRMLAQHRGAHNVAKLLAAKEIDILERVLGLPPVTRCKTCFKPTSGEDVHFSCRDGWEFSCENCLSNELSSPRGQPITPDDFQEARKKNDSLTMMTYAFRQKCGGCGQLVGKRDFHAIAKKEDQPQSTKVARTSSASSSGP